MTKYRVDQNEGVRPREGTPLVQATDTIEYMGVFTLIVLHVLVHGGEDSSQDRRGFSATVKTNDGLAVEGLFPIFGEGDEAYSSAKTNGIGLLHRKFFETNGLAVQVS